MSKPSESTSNELQKFVSACDSGDTVVRVQERGHVFTPLVSKVMDVTPGRYTRFVSYDVLLEIIHDCVIGIISDDHQLRRLLQSRAQ